MANSFFIVTPVSSLIFCETGLLNSSSICPAVVSALQKLNVVGVTFVSALPVFVVTSDPCTAFSLPSLLPQPLTSVISRIKHNPSDNTFFIAPNIIDPP